MKGDFYMRRVLSREEMDEVKGNEAISLTSVIAVLAVSLLISVAYRFFVSEKGSAILPGGFTFTWGK